MFTKVNNPAIIKDRNSNEYLTYIGEENITIHCLPTLEILSTCKINPKLGLSFICSSDDNCYLYCINKSGNKICGIINDKKE